ncbi:MAG TPA: hypothetical protein PLP61_13240 [Nocardioides sp.]|uniref:hypothetical protein n=1 Tax=Nocardioides sp. TaxID=35761 RepID=UPI002BE41EA8|nr:hypothetical protein [Nocardioides sp.]HQR27997.1 hypothetical protein [Nocardioides sp.]
MDPTLPGSRLALARTLEQQSGVISRRQVLEAGGGPADLERMLRRRELVRLLPGVYLDHTGEPTWTQLAWAGVLYHWPAALAEGSALRAAAGGSWPASTEPIVLAVPQDRHVEPPAGYRVTRPSRFEQRVLWNTGPPRIRVEEAVLDEAARVCSDLDAVAVLTRVCQQRLTTAGRITTALQGRGRIRRRPWLSAVLADIAAGTCSTLEHGYLTYVERPHGLPPAQRQAPASARSGAAYRDALYTAYSLVVELDGRAFHEGPEQHDRDLDRDLDALVDGQVTVRLGWGQVFGRSCLTAVRVGALLGQRGWTGSARPCAPGCPAGPFP